MSEQCGQIHMHFPVMEQGWNAAKGDGQGWDMMGKVGAGIEHGSDKNFVSSVKKFYSELCLIFVFWHGLESSDHSFIIFFTVM